MKMEQLSFKEYINKTKKVYGKRKSRTSHSFGVNEAAVEYKRVCGKVDTHTFREIIKRINTILGDELASGKAVIFPYRMGRLDVRKFETTVRYDDNGLYTNYPVDWDKTLKYWHDNPEAEAAKKLIRNPVKEVFRVYYRRIGAAYNNKQLVVFRLSRVIKNKMKKKIINNELDAYKI